MAKEAKLKNSAPIKYHIEIANRFWDGIFKAEGITDRDKLRSKLIALYPEFKTNIMLAFNRYM